MSSTRWEWADTSGSSPRLRRVADATQSHSAEAYRKYIAHGTDCDEGCPEKRCAMGDELWQAYEDAKGPATNGA